MFRDRPHSDSELAFFNGPLDDIDLISPELDIAWRHAYSPGFALVLGGRMAGTFSLGGRNATSHETRGELLPVGGAFIGVRF